MTDKRAITLEDAAAKGLLSQDVAEEKRAQLKQLFPEVFMEDKIDFEQLRRVMGDWVEPGKERYGLNWPGKADCMKVIQAPSLATLKPAREESVDFDNTQNLFIEGDNLEVLKLLQKAYFNKVKMIYIDPPYNTGKDFIYSDKYQDNLNTYLDYTGQRDEKGRKFSTNTDAGGRFHSNWLNMMYPRLYLARNLLRDDGVIFISIDDGEQANLRQLCDLIFGAEDFIANIIWHKKYAASNDAKGVPAMHDFILAYAKSGNFERGLLPRTEKQDSLYKYDDGDGKGRWRPDNLTVKTVSQSYLYEILNPNTGDLHTPSQGRCWLTSESKMHEWIKEGRVFFGRDGKGAPQLKRYLSEVQQGVVPTTYWSYNEVGHTDSSRKELKALFNGIPPFDNPKPTRLLERITEVAKVENNDIVLDFFSGSCTTAHAVMQLNAKDGGNRKFIMVQLPEPCDEKSEAFKAGYKTIADIGRERIRRAAAKIRKEQKDSQTARAAQLALDGDEKPAAPLDLGFRAFRLAPSNFAIWEGDVDKIDDLEKQLEMHIDHIDRDSTTEDILYELLLKCGYPPTEPIARITVGNNQAYSVRDHTLVICLDDQISIEFADRILDYNPSRVICLDRAFAGDDQLKTNLVQTFKSRARRQEDAIVFHTV